MAIRTSPNGGRSTAAPAARMSGSRILCESLLREGVEVIFGFPGGVLLPLYDVLPEYPIRHILVRHEQGAAHAADGYARATGRVGVCLATSGPGATNLVTGIATAHLDSSPMVAITGQVSTPYIGKDSFQETDITGITLPITKHNYLVEDVGDLAETIAEAFYIANTGRPGPVLVDVPKDVLMAEGTFEYPLSVKLRGYKPTLHGNVRQIRQAAEIVNAAQRPLIIAGHGVIISDAFAELRELAEKAEIPVITTLLGISSFPESHNLSFGMIGMHGMAYANMAVQGADLILAIGMRYDDRATGKVATFAPHARIIHIDVDPAEIGKNVRVDVPIVGDVRNVLQMLNKHVDEASHHEWVEQLRTWRIQRPTTQIRETEQLLPQYVIRQIYEATKGDAIVVADVGQNQMWAAQHFWYDKPNSYITSGGLGTMGFSLPAAMGVKVGRPDDTVWVICGDGGFQMNLQELATVMQERLPLKMAIIDNGYLGMIRQWQDVFYNQRFHHSHLVGPDFVKLAEAYGMLGLRVTEKSQARPAIEQAMAHEGPVLIDFVVESAENVFPMVPQGSSLSEMLHEPID